MDTEIKIITSYLDDESIVYTNSSQFLVQIGRGKSAYKTRYCITGNLGQAVAYYNGLNIGNGYKKRLICFSLNKPVLARQFSY